VWSVTFVFSFYAYQGLVAGFALRSCTRNEFVLSGLSGAKRSPNEPPAHHVGPMFRASTLSTADLPPPSARRVPRSRRGDGWDALADIEVFVFAVEAELEGMGRGRGGVHRRGGHA